MNVFILLFYRRSNRYNTKCSSSSLCQSVVFQTDVSAPAGAPSHQRTIQVLLALAAHQFGAKRAAVLWQEPSGPVLLRSDSQRFAILLQRRLFYSVSLEVNTTRHWSACEEHYECHNIIGWRHVNLCSVDTFVSMWCVSRARAPQRCSLTLSRWTVKCPGFGWSSKRWMRRGERPFCEHRQRWRKHEVSQFPKVELLDYSLGDDFSADSLVSMPNSGGSVYNNRADGYGGGMCSFKPLFRLIIIVEAAIKSRERKTCDPWVAYITLFVLDRSANLKIVIFSIPRVLIHSRNGFT